MQTIPVLLAILVGTLFGLLVWGLVRSGSRETGESLAGARDDVLTGLLVLSAFGLGVFLTYVVVTIG